MRLVDSHGHVQVDAFASDRDAVLDAARAGGVERLLVPGYDAASSTAAVDLASRVTWLDAAAGIHPHDAAASSAADWETVVGVAAEPEVVAIGETGLDFDRMHSPRDAQVENLRRHLALAIATGKPAILHCRSAAGERDAQDLLLDEMRAAGFGGEAARRAFGERPPAVLHSFSGPVDYAEAALELGLAISFSGLVFRKTEAASADVARLVPGERLLVETDSPFLAPPGVPRGSWPGGGGRRNAPEWVRITAQWLAERRGEPAEALGTGLVDAYDRTFPRAIPR